MRGKFCEVSVPQPLFEIYTEAKQTLYFDHVLVHDLNVVLLFTYLTLKGLVKAL